MSYRIILERRAEKDFRSIRDTRLKRRIAAAIDALADAPRAAGAKKMQGYDELWRVRIGDWRICYRIEDARLIVLVITVAPRAEVYELLRRRVGR